MQVEALLRAVNATNDFENELAARFGAADKHEVQKPVAPHLRTSLRLCSVPLTARGTVTCRMTLAAQDVVRFVL